MIYCFEPLVLFNLRQLTDLDVGSNGVPGAILADLPSLKRLSANSQNTVCSDNCLKHTLSAMTQCTSLNFACSPSHCDLRNILCLSDMPWLEELRGHLIVDEEQMNANTTLMTMFNLSYLTGLRVFTAQLHVVPCVKSNSNPSLGLYLPPRARFETICLHQSTCIMLPNEMCVIDNLYLHGGGASDIRRIVKTATSITCRPTLYGPQSFVAIELLRNANTKTPIRLSGVYSRDVFNHLDRIILITHIDISEAVSIPPILRKLRDSSSAPTLKELIIRPRIHAGVPFRIQHVDVCIQEPLHWSDLHPLVALVSLETLVAREEILFCACCSGKHLVPRKYGDCIFHSVYAKCKSLKRIDVFTYNALKKTEDGRPGARQSQFHPFNYTLLARGTLQRLSRTYGFHMKYLDPSTNKTPRTPIVRMTHANKHQFDCCPDSASVIFE